MHACVCVYAAYRQTRATSRALPQLLRLTRETISGTICPASISRPTRSDACSPRAISVCMSASFFCTSWLLPNGAPNCSLSKGCAVHANVCVFVRT